MTVEVIDRLCQRIRRVVQQGGLAGDLEKDAREALEGAMGRVVELERIIREELGYCVECFHALEVNSGHEADCPIAIEQGLNLVPVPENT